jgi:hypothetical protein
MGEAEIKRKRWHLLIDHLASVAALQSRQAWKSKCEIANAGGYSISAGVGEKFNV